MFFANLATSFRSLSERKGSSNSSVPDSSDVLSRIYYLFVQRKSNLADFLSHKSLFVAEEFITFTGNGDIREYKLNIVQRIFLMLDRRSSCILAQVKMLLMMIVIALSVLVVILSSMSSFSYQPSTCRNPVCANHASLCPDRIVCEPVAENWLVEANWVCAIIFLLDFGSRFLLSGCVPTRLTGIMYDSWDDDEVKNAKKESREVAPDPVYSMPYQMLLYALTLNSIIDISAFLPTFLSRFGEIEDNSTAFLRLLRFMQGIKFVMGRKQTSEMIDIIVKTFQKSKYSLMVLLFYFFALVVILACFQFAAERGIFKVTADYPRGAYLRPTVLENGREELSSFNGIPASMYWAVVTICTVGFGDLYPTTTAGRFIGCLGAFFGILCIALPVSVLGTNFNKVIVSYHRFKEEKRVIMRSNLEMFDVMSLERKASVCIDVAALEGIVEDRNSTADPDSEDGNFPDLSRGVGSIRNLEQPYYSSRPQTDFEFCGPENFSHNGSENEGYRRRGLSNASNNSINARLRSGESYNYNSFQSGNNEGLSQSDSINVEPHRWHSEEALTTIIESADGDAQPVGSRKHEMLGSVKQHNPEYLNSMKTETDHDLEALQLRLQGHQRVIPARDGSYKHFNINIAALRGHQHHEPATTESNIGIRTRSVTISYKPFSSDSAASGFFGSSNERDASSSFSRLKAGRRLDRDSPTNFSQHSVESNHSTMSQKGTIAPAENNNGHVND